jgi:8-oxo-dGTP diphosphatase
MLPPEEYYQSLPRKRVGASVLFVNEHEQWLVLKPTYKDSWLLPGGTVEENESPRAGALREAQEEIGIEPQNVVLCGAHYGAVQGVRTEVIRFTFFGGVLSAEQQARITLPPGEIAAFKFVSADEAKKLLGSGFGDSISLCIEALQVGKVAYGEY